MDDGRPQEFSGPVDVRIPHRVPLLDHVLFDQVEDGLRLVRVIVDRNERRGND